MNTTLRTICGVVLLWLLGGCATNATPTPASVKPATAPTPTVTATSSVSIDLLQRKLYRHSSGIFAIDAPQGWRIEDNSSVDELRVRFREPNENAAIATTVLTISQQLDSRALTHLLQAHLRNTYGAQSGFRLEGAVVQANSSVQIVWHCDSAFENGTTQLSGSSRIAQSGNHVALVSVIVPDTQFASLAPEIAAITNSYTINASAVGDTRALVSVEIGELQRYAYANGLFQLDVPVGWVEQNQSAPGKAFVTWNDPASKSWLMVDVLQDDSQRSPGELGALLSAVIGEAFVEKTGLTLAEPVVQDDNSVLLEWNYTAPTNTGVAALLQGRSFARQDGDKVVIMAIATPADQSEQLQGQLDTIRASLIVDPTATIP